MPARPLTSSRGFTLIEALIAIGLMAVAAASLAALTSVATRSVASARHRTLGTVTAAALLARAARADAAPTAASCLRSDVAGCSDAVDDRGLAVAGAVYRRRWYVGPRPGAIPGRIVVGCAGAERDMGVSARHAPGSCLVAVAVEVRP